MYLGCALSSLYCVMLCAQSKPVLASSGIKVMTYNIHHANPPSTDSLIDIDSIVQVIRMQSPDLVALQEVDQFTRRSLGQDQARIIAEKLGMNYFFAKAMDYDGGAYGQAILSRFPITATAVHRLPADAKFIGEPRIVGEATIQLPSGTALRFATVHLDAQRGDENRLLQAKAISRLVAAEESPMIIAGDFNAVVSSEPMRVLDKVFTNSCTSCDFTIPVLKPSKTIDFILLDRRKAWTIISHQTIKERYASDHFPVVTILQ